MTLYWVDVGYAVGGIVVENGVVTRAAPIFNWTVGKKWTEVEIWARKRKAEIRVAN